MEDSKKRLGAVKTDTPLKDKLKSTSFIMAVVLLVGGLFQGITEANVAPVVQSLIGLIGGVFTLRQFIKPGTFNPIEWAKNSNTYLYLGTILISFFPKLKPELFSGLHDIVLNAINGNWTGFATSIFALVTILWNVFKGGNASKLFTAMVVVILLPMGTQAQTLDNIKYKRELKKETKRSVKLQEEWPIVIDPIESVPKNVKKKYSTAAGPNNWGQLLILPDSIKSRLQSECKTPGQIEVYDTGGKWDHPYLSQGQVPGSSYTGEALLDGHGHSTHCAGIIGADQFGILDALIDNGICKIKPVKILTNTGSGSFDYFTNAVKTEDTQHKQIIANGGFVVGSCSFGGGTALQANVETALKASTDLGVIYVFAAGNTGSAVNYPGNSQYALTCSALAENLAVASYSSRGAQVDNAMPGSNINSTYKGGTFASLSGTSMATPFMAACVFIAKSKYGAKLPNYKAVEAYFAKIAKDLPPAGRDDATGYGMLFVKAILDNDPGSVGSPDPVDPDPVDPPTGPITREERTLTFTVTGRFPMYWNVQGAASQDEPKLIKINKKNATTAATNVVYLTKLDLDLKTKNLAPYSREQLVNGVKWFFTNRGLVLSPNSDYVDAAMWSGYFMDMILLKDKSLDFKVRGIVAEDEMGNSITLNTENMKTWPIGSSAAIDVIQGVSPASGPIGGWISSAMIGDTRPPVPVYANGSALGIGSFQNMPFHVEGATFPVLQITDKDLNAKN